jgi:protein disulfide-isomerase A6
MLLGADTARFVEIVKICYSSVTEVVCRQQLAPKYETLANNFAGDKDVVIAKVDATEHGELADRFGVTGYPTLKFFPADSKDPVDYQGEREVGAMTEFLNEHAGTSRNADGTLKEGAGHVAALNDIIISANGVFDNNFLTSITNAAKDLTGKAAEHGKLYVNAASKVVSKGVDYPAKEIARLEGMLKSTSVTAEQKGNFQLRQSILKAFQ